MKLFLRIFFAALLISGQSFAQGSLPATYQVIDINLNVRTGPGARFADIGSLDPFAQIVVVRFNDRKTWAEIEWEGSTAWISARFINRVSGDAQTATAIQPPVNNLTGDMLLNASEVSCVGTEPFWNLDIMDQTQLTYSTPEHEPVTSIIESIDASANNTSSQMFSSFGFTGIVHRLQCNDGMSDTVYDWAIDLVVNDGFGAKLYSGCCSIVQN